MVDGHADRITGRMRADDKSRWHRKIPNILVARSKAPLQDRPDPYDPREPQLWNHKIDQTNYPVELPPGNELLRERQIEKNLASGARNRGRINCIVAKVHRGPVGPELWSAPDDHPDEHVRRLACLPRGGSCFAWGQMPTMQHFYDTISTTPR